MPAVVECFRIYKGDDGKEVVESHRMLGINAREAVKNGRGEWKMSLPPDKAKAAVSVQSKQDMTDSETRPERRGRSGKRAEGGLAAAEEAAGEGVE